MMMEKWDSYYHQEDLQTEIYSGASHVRYPVTEPLCNHAMASLGPEKGHSVTTSATADGAKTWSTYSSDSELQLSPPKSPTSLDDPQVCHGVNGVC